MTSNFVQVVMPRFRIRKAATIWLLTDTWNSVETQCDSWNEAMQLVVSLKPLNQPYTLNPQTMWMSPGSSQTGYPPA